MDYTDIITPPDAPEDHLEPEDHDGSGLRMGDQLLHEQARQLGQHYDSKAIVEEYWKGCMPTGFGDNWPDSYFEIERVIAFLHELSGAMADRLEEDGLLDESESEEHADVRRKAEVRGARAIKNRLKEIAREASRG